MTDLIEIITSDSPDVRNQSLDRFCEGKSTEQLLNHCEQLDVFADSVTISTNVFARCSSCTRSIVFICLRR